MLLGEGMSLLVPFREDSSGTRTRAWKWLRRFWEAQLPGSEIVIGEDDGMPYSKSVAINDAAARAHGDILVILDADTLIEPDVLVDCANRIRAAVRPVWYLPHGRAERLTQKATEELYVWEPDGHGVPFGPWCEDELEDRIEVPPGFAQVLSRRAFKRVGGMDPRFRGWGGEDTAFVRAVDTLYGKHLRTPNHVTHLWHSRPGAGSSRTRRWDGQDGPRPTRALSAQYRGADGDRIEMRQLVDEGLGRQA